MANNTAFLINGKQEIPGCSKALAIIKTVLAKVAYKWILCAGTNTLIDFDYMSVIIRCCQMWEQPLSVLHGKRVDDNVMLLQLNPPGDASQI